MGYLNRLISRNAELARERAHKEKSASGQSMRWADVARGMAARLDRRAAERKSGGPVRYDEATVARTLRQLRKDKATWTIDYLEAFCATVGAMPERVLSADYDDSKVDDATYASFLSNALGRRLTPEQFKRITRNLQSELEQPGMFDLISDLAEALMKARSADEARGAAVRLIDKSAAFAPKSPKTNAPRKRKNNP